MRRDSGGGFYSSRHIKQMFVFWDLNGRHRIDRCFKTPRKKKTSSRCCWVTDTKYVSLWGIEVCTLTGLAVYFKDLSAGSSGLLIVQFGPLILKLRSRCDFCDSPIPKWPPSRLPERRRRTTLERPHTEETPQVGFNWLHHHGGTNRRTDVPAANHG